MCGDVFLCDDNSFREACVGINLIECQIVRFYFIASTKCTQG